MEGGLNGQALALFGCVLAVHVAFLTVTLSSCVVLQYQLNQSDHKKNKGISPTLWLQLCLCTYALCCHYAVLANGQKAHFDVCVSAGVCAVFFSLHPVQVFFSGVISGMIC